MKSKAERVKSNANYEQLGDGWGLFISLCRFFPDFLLDLYRSDSADYGEETLIQRVIMRAKARHQYVDITGCRGLTKTSTTFKSLLVDLQLWPGIQVAYYGPSYKQLSGIAVQTYRQLTHDYPNLARLLSIDAATVDRFDASTKGGSALSVAAMRGRNLHSVVAEETAQEGVIGFDAEAYKQVILPAIRLQYMVGGRPDPAYIPYKQHSITSAGRRQQYAYETRCTHLQMMARGESAFVADIPYDVLILSQMRPVSWAEGLRSQLTPEEWAREMGSIYTGTDENPVVTDEVLHRSRSLLMPEEHHCCKDQQNKLGPEDVFYVIGYDVSYEDAKKNAKCACVVVKCTKHKDYLKRDRYLKQVVWVEDWAPMNPMEQARRLKRIWKRYCWSGSDALIAIDSWQYGEAVLQSLMMDLGDGLPVLCIYDHAKYAAFEVEGSLPLIYPIKAGGVGTTDPDAEMIRYAEVQFDQGNVQLLTSDHQAGIESYKKYHKIRDDKYDSFLYQPYQKTKELVGQIQNLKKVQTTAGISERRLSKFIQRDSWSALKYALRLCCILERKYLVKPQRKSNWDALIRNSEVSADRFFTTGRSRVISRKGGRIC